MIMVTGASGFIGSKLLRKISTSYERVVGILRDSHESKLAPIGIELRNISAVDSNTDWSQVLDGVSCVVHCAAVAHGKSGDVREVNVAGALNLACQAAEAGVYRFVFLSSIGVNGNINTRPFTEGDVPNPVGPYAQSKWEAEQGLWKIQRETGMEIVIIRPPLVYGPKAPGNFGSLVNWINKGIPLPLGAIHNQRTLVALDNLVDLIITCIDHPAAANQVFLAGDDEDISTTELLRGVARAMGTTPRLIPVSTGLLMAGATMLGKRAVAQRLLGSLQVDIAKAQERLGWRPPLSVEEGLKQCFTDY